MRERFTARILMTESFAFRLRITVDMPPGLG